MAGKMAAAESKYDNVWSCETEKRNVSTITLHREIECYRFKLYDLIYYLTSASFFFIDIATDNIVFMEYFLQGHLVWGYFALSFTVLPASVIQMFSLRWYHSDGSIKNVHWLLHFLFLGVLHRYLVLLYTAVYSLRSKRFVKDKNWVYRQESDLCMLHLFESFMGAAPQLILQLYVMAVLRRMPLWTSISAVVCFCSLSWAIGTYMKAMHKLRPGNRDAGWITLTLQGFWRGGMMISRISVLVLIVICLRQWSLLFVGLHWLFMTIWVILQNTDFCPTLWEERIYNCIIGFIYCFDFFNLQVGKSRYRVLIFYTVIVTENIVFLIVYVLYFRDVIKAEDIPAALSLIIGGMMIGLTSMLFYYGRFHPSRNPVATDNTERRVGDEDIVTKKVVSPRSFKQRSACSVDHSNGTTLDEITTDKQSLLTSIVQSSECPENGVLNQNCKIENESQTAICISATSHESARKNLIKDDNISSKTNVTKSATEECVEIEGMKNDRRPIRLTTPLELDVAEENKVKVTNAFTLEKRRGICFSNQLILEMEKDAGDKSDRNFVGGVMSVPDDLDECCVDNVLNDLNGIASLRERLATPTIFNDTASDEISETNGKLSKHLQQKDETMSCVTSIHDYENVCPLGVARPPWCIRSWKGYTDIETYIHDDSVVRDRRRDTLTSTTTGTTYSSEFSDATCTSSILRGVLKQDDYLDTLTYDLTDSRDIKTGYNEDTSNAKGTNDLEEEQSSTIYIAKPIVIDEKGGMFALDTIVEEHDEISVDEKFEYSRRSVCDTVSTLVSTIDQIRKYTLENSPRHVYHTTGNQWEDFDPKSLIKKAQLTKALFESELKDSSPRNCLDRSDESGCKIDAVKGLVKYCTVESIGKTPLIDAILSDSPILPDKTKKRVSEENVDSKENDLYVEMSPLVSGDNCIASHSNLSQVNDDIEKRRMDETNRIRQGSSIESTDNAAKSERMEKLEPSSDKRKKAIDYPRRKFSLLKEKFESKSQLVYVVTPNNVVKIEPSVSSELDPFRKNAPVGFRKSMDCSKQDKENLAPATVTINDGTRTSNDGSQIVQENVDLIDENSKSLCNNDLNLKERRHIFLEQVLSPPKLLTWNKKKSFNGTGAKKL